MNEFSVGLVAGCTLKNVALQPERDQPVVTNEYTKPLTRSFGLIFGVIYFAGLLLIVLPWLQVIG
ncbi:MULTISPECIES: hypothetical protein [unclassified Bradyrhizobium]|uniref:hypothetical protein n=1 Tax=unclassified Bradyrhizobium TaxID=2631580 RepID=UPI00143D4C63|nr:MULTISPECIES: hypothetical protein [unclassified Bradyrhizobium]